MTMTLTASRWICLLSLAVVMIFSASEVDSIKLGMSCCTKTQNRVFDYKVKRCYKQVQRENCPDAYVIITDKDEKVCVKPTPPKLKQLLSQGLVCPNDISKRRRFKLFDDVE